MLRLSVALSCVALTHSVRSYLDTEEANMEVAVENATASEQAHVDARLYDMMGGRLRSAECLVDYPSQVLASFQKIKCLGSGSFGVSYLTYDTRKPIKDKYGKQTYEQVVVKLLYTQEGGRNTHLTWSKALANRDLKDKALEASAECDIAGDIQKLPTKPGRSHGRDRIMACYEHNIPPSGTIKTAPGVPLFLILQNCGAQPLTYYVQNKASNLGVMALLFKQLLEAVDYLSTSQFSYIHHDLKPDNVVVKEEGGDYFLYLIDFGGTVKSSTRCSEVSKITATSPAYAPHEWKSNGQCGMSNYNMNAPWAFDMYASAVVALDLASGSMYGIKTKECPSCDLLMKHGGCPPSPPYNGQDCSLSMATYSPGHSTGYVCLAEELGMTSSTSANNPFFQSMELIAKALDLEGTKRPRPSDFLDSPIWSAVPSQGVSTKYGTAPSPMYRQSTCKRSAPQPAPHPAHQPGGNKPAYQPGNYPAYQPGGNKPAYQPGNYPAYQPGGNKPAYQPGNYPAYQPGGNKPAYQPGNYPAYQPGGNKPVYQPGIYPAQQPAIRPAYQPGNYPAYQPGGNKPAIQPGNYPAYTPAGNYVPQRYGH